MNKIQERIEQTITKRKALDLHSHYMNLALGTRTTGDRILFEDYYQRAEYYLHLMNKLEDGFTIMPLSKASPLFKKRRNSRHNKLDFHRKHPARSFAS